MIDLQCIFSGDLDVNSIKVSKKAIVTGKFTYNSLVVEDGASIEGEFKKRENAVKPRRFFIIQIHKIRAKWQFVYSTRY